MPNLEPGAPPMESRGTGVNEHRYEAWTTGPDSEPCETMEIVYTRN